jgi:hypothetical protein
MTSVTGKILHLKPRRPIWKKTRQKSKKIKRAKRRSGKNQPNSAKMTAIMDGVYRMGKVYASIPEESLPDFLRTVRKEDITWMQPMAGKIDHEPVIAYGSAGMPQFYALKHAAQKTLFPRKDVIDAIKRAVEAGEDVATELPRYPDGRPVAPRCVCDDVLKALKAGAAAGTPAAGAKRQAPTEPAAVVAVAAAAPAVAPAPPPQKKRLMPEVVAAAAAPAAPQPRAAMAPPPPPPPAKYALGFAGLVVAWHALLTERSDDPAECKEQEAAVAEVAKIRAEWRGVAPDDLLERTGDPWKHLAVVEMLLAHYRTPVAVPGGALARNVLAVIRNPKTVMVSTAPFPQGIVPVLTQPHLVAIAESVALDPVRASEMITEYVQLASGMATADMVADHFAAKNAALAGITGEKAVKQFQTSVSYMFGAAVADILGLPQ